MATTSRRFLAAGTACHLMRPENNNRDLAAPNSRPDFLTAPAEQPLFQSLRSRFFASRPGVVFCETTTSKTFYAATHSDWSRTWDDDWDGQHPADQETKDWMRRKIPKKKEKGCSSSTAGGAITVGGGPVSAETGGTSDKEEEKKSVFTKPAPAPTVRHIFLIRHGQYNLDDDSESELTEMGRHQSKKTGERLKAMADGLKKDHYGEIKIKWKRVVSSTLIRAEQTADIIAEVLGTTVSERDPLLNEGTPCLTHPSGQLPEQVLETSKKAKLLKDPPRIESAFHKYVYRKQNWKKLKERAERAARQQKKEGINEAYSGPEKVGGEGEEEEEDTTKTKHEYEVIVCHMNVIRYFVVRALQLPPEAWLRFRGDNCGITEIIVYDDGRISLGRFGDQGHLTIEETTFH